MANREHIERFYGALDSYFETRVDYSGRGMYGDTCVSVTIDHDETRFGDVFQAILDIGMDLDAVEDPNEEDAKLANAYDSFLRSASMDDMGTGMVIYFPAADTTGWEKTEDEEDSQ